VGATQRITRTRTSDCAGIQGAGEIVFHPGGLIQDPAQLQGQQVERQQLVLDGCCGEAAEEGCNGSSKNGGAAAGERPLVIFPMSRRRERTRREKERMRDRGGRLSMREIDEESEESGTESEEEDLNGGAAARAAARIVGIDSELWKMQAHPTLVTTD
jgi:hypothetical protein